MKWCSGCKTSKSLDEFVAKKTSKDGKQSQCKGCRNAYGKRWYSKNKDVHKENISAQRARYRKANRILICEYLEDHPCVDCGEDDIVVLDFDHLRDKKEAVTFMIHDYPPSKILEEIEKCVVRCANCHRRKTATTGNFYRVQYQQCVRARSG
jgi:hypothetical protein